MKPYPKRHAAVPGAHRYRPATGRLRRRLAATVLVCVGLAAGLVATPSVNAAQGAAKLLSLNVCGVVCRDGEVDTTAEYVYRRTRGHNASVVFLQEICYSQYRQIRSLLHGDGYSTLYTSTTKSGTCNNHDDRYGTGFGIALLVKGKTSGREVLPLPVTPGATKRSMLGATAMIGGRATFVAVVHNSPSAAEGLNNQLRVLAGYLNRKAARPVIVGGDFNATPQHPGMVAFYSRKAGGTGKFTELDETRYGAATRSGRPTFRASRKIDYIFASAAHFGSPRANTSRTPMSDHCLYWGFIQVRRG